MKLIWPLLLFTVACSSNQMTPYKKEKKNEGYADSSLKGMRVATFKGNSSTKKEVARNFAEFRAIEVCRNANEGKHAAIIEILDKSFSKEIRRSSSSSYGPSGISMYPYYYSRYSTIGFGVNYNTIDTESWNETYNYPVIEVLYRCEDLVFRPKLSFRELNADQMRDLVKDVKGGIQVEEILDERNKVSLKIGDIIIRGEGNRIEHVYQLNALFTDKKKVVSVELFREGAKFTKKVYSDDVTKDVTAHEEELIRKVCTSKGKPENNSICK